MLRSAILVLPLVMLAGVLCAQPCTPPNPGDPNTVDYCVNPASITSPVCSTLNSVVHIAYSPTILFSGLTLTATEFDLTSVTNLPAGVSVTLSNNVGSLAETITFTAAASTVTAGTYTVTINALVDLAFMGSPVQNDAPFTATYDLTFTNCAVSPTPNLSASVTQQPLCAGGTGTIVATVTSGTAPYTFTLMPGNTVIGPQNGTTATFNNVAPGTYMVVVSGGGLDTVTNLVVNNPGPIQFNGNPTVVHTTCGQSNGSISTSAAGGTGTLTYSWNDGGPATASRLNLASGVYVLTATDGNGCSASDTFTVNPSSAPNAAFTLNPSPPLTNQATSFIATGPNPGTATFTWQVNAVTVGSNNDTIQYTFATTGNYSVRLIVTDGACTDTFTLAVTVNQGTISLTELTSNEFAVYPNPANGRVQLAGSVLNGQAASVRLLNVAGQVVHTQALAPATRAELSLQGVAPGVYTLVVLDSRQQALGYTRLLVQ